MTNHASLKKSSTRNTTVTLCMLTWRRPVLLRAALLSLAAQTLTANPDIDLELILVDNDAACSAASVFELLRPQLPFPAYYVVERRKGLTYARNRALAEASGTDFIAFLDDDEVADPNWLDALLSAQRTYNADVVSGPVLPVIDGAPDWLLKGDFFATRHHRTGTPITFVETKNVLFRGRFAREFRFDIRFNQTSGEDTHFFMQLERAGATMVWAADARVHETISRERTTVAWLVDRAQNEANRYTRSRLYINPGPLTHLLGVLKAASSLVKGSLLLLTCLARPHRAVHGLSNLSHALGTVKGLFGLSVPTATAHPSSHLIKRRDPIPFNRRAEDATTRPNRRNSPPRDPHDGVIEPGHPHAQLPAPDTTLSRVLNASSLEAAYHETYGEDRPQPPRPFHHPGHAGRPVRSQLHPPDDHRLQKLHLVALHSDHADHTSEDQNLPDPR